MRKTHIRGNWYAITPKIPLPAEQFATAKSKTVFVRNAAQRNEIAMVFTSVFTGVRFFNNKLLFQAEKVTF